MGVHLDMLVRDRDVLDEESQVVLGQGVVARHGFALIDVRVLHSRLGRGHRVRRIDFDTLDVQSLRELVRLIRDLEHAVNRARMMPWAR